MSNIFKFIKTHSKTIIQLTIIIAVILGALSYIAYLPFQNNTAEKTIKDEYNYGTKFSGTGTNIPNNFVNRYDRVDYKIVLSKFDIMKPVYSLISANVYKGQPENFFYNVQTIYLERTGVDSWKVINYRNNEVRDINLSEATKLASKYDITTDFPGKSNYKITNYPPLTQEQIENNRKLREQTEAFEKKQKEDLEKRKNTPKEVTYKNCVDGTNLLYTKYEEAKKQGLTELDGINLNTLTPEELKKELDTALALCKTVLNETN